MGAREIIQGAMNFLHIFSQHQHDYQVGQQQKGVVVLGWQPPSNGLCKINVDGAYNGVVAGIGVIIRNHLGNVLASMAAHLSGIVNATVRRQWQCGKLSSQQGTLNYLILCLSLIFKSCCSKLSLVLVVFLPLGVLLSLSIN